VFLSNSDSATPINVVSNNKPDGNDIVDVYTIMGIRIRSQVKRSQATIGLPNGLYIVGRKKIFVYNGI
jgi:hypothetical protein